LGADELRAALDEVGAAQDRPHVERLALTAAIVSEALRLDGLEATLVGGGAIEFYVPGAYTTSDIDLVVERREPVPDLEPVLHRVFAGLGFQKAGRHWVRGDSFIEVPDTRVIDPVSSFDIGPWTLRVLRKEILLGERVVGFQHWRVTGYGAQALDMMAAFGVDMDESILREYLRREGAIQGWERLRQLAASDEIVTEAVLQRVLDELHEGSGSQGAWQ
jgi:hypothetical protein